MSRIFKDYPLVAIRAEDLDGRVDFVRIFGRSGPIHIEVGTGRAGFLLSEALARPDVNFLGIEWASRYYRYAVDRIGRWSLSNVRIIRTDAAGFLADSLPDESVNCFHIYFPDPWPKRRHHKRRFFCPASLKQLLRCLKLGGLIRTATDHGEYFELITALIATEKGRLEPAEFLPAAGARQCEWVGTNFERKYLMQHRPIFFLAVRKNQAMSQP